MSVDDIIQLMRQCSIAQVRELLVLWKEKRPKDYVTFHEFYTKAYARKPKA